MMNWKSDIFSQLKQVNKQTDAFQTVLANYNNLIEDNNRLRVRCSKLEEDLENLRLANVGLERAQNASQEFANVNNRLTEANQEVIMHLREKGELAQEILRLNRALTELQAKFSEEETKNRNSKMENEKLIEKVEQFDAKIEALENAKEIILEERKAIEKNYEQLQKEYNKLKPEFLELSQKVEEGQRIIKEREAEIIRCKSLQLEIFNGEIERYNRKLEERKRSTSGSNSSIPQETSEKTRTTSVTNSSNEKGNGSTGGGNFLSTLKHIFQPGTPNPNLSTLISAPAMPCFSASIPKRQIHEWNCTELEVYAMQFQPSGSLLATGCSDRLIHLWDVSSFGHAYRVSSLEGSDGAINCLDFDSERGQLLAGTSSKVVYVWSYGDNRRPKEIFTGHTGVINACKFHSSRFLITAGADRMIKKWDLQTRHCVRTLFPPSKCHDLIIVDAMGTVISAHHDKKIRFWDTLNDQCRDEISFDASITSLSFNPDNNLLSLCLRNDSIQLFDLRQKRVLHSLSDEHFQVGLDTHKAIFSPDGQYICSGSNDGSLIFWNAKTGQTEQIFEKKHKMMVTGVVWHPDGRIVASCEKQRRVILWSD